MIDSVASWIAEERLAAASPRRTSQQDVDDGSRRQPWQTRRDLGAAVASIDSRSGLVEMGGPGVSANGS